MQRNCVRASVISRDRRSQLDQIIASLDTQIAIYQPDEAKKSVK